MVLYKNKCKDLIAEFPITDCHITSLLLCPIQGLMVAGTSRGTLRIYNWPLLETFLEYEMTSDKKVKIKPPVYEEINAHSYPVVTMCTSHDESYLFTGS